MGEMVAFTAGAWITAAALDAFAEYFVETTVGGSLQKISDWVAEMRNWKSKQEEALEDVHQELRQGMNALSTALSVIKEEQTRGTEAILAKLVELRETDLHDRQLAELTKATNALNDIRERRFEAGHPRNPRPGVDFPFPSAAFGDAFLESCSLCSSPVLDLLKTASSAAENAARYVNGSLMTKLQSYRLWIIAEYMYEAATRECRAAKGSVMFILGQIIRDPAIVRICRKYYDPQSAPSTSPAHGRSPTQFRTSSVDSFESAAAFRLSEAEESVLPFLLEVISSAAILAPIEQDVACEGVVRVVGAAMKSTAGGKVQLTGGRIQFGPSAPLPVILAMGKYCSANEKSRRSYPSVADVVEEAWGQNKERLALDNFFRHMNGPRWMHREGWQTEHKEGNGRNLSERFGISTENGRVAKINLAANKLEGVIQEDLADCERLRELVLHENSITGGVPERLRMLLRSREIIATGIPEATRSERIATPVVSPPPSTPGSDVQMGGTKPQKPKKKGGFLAFMKESTYAGWDAGISP